jgi:hypothetical protein
MSWVISVAITPVGGWCMSNPHREDYMNAFVITGIASLLSIVNLGYVNHKSNKS